MEAVAKRAFLAGVTCHTQGWRAHHAPEKPPSDGLAWRFYAGADVARRAREWLGAGETLPWSPLDAALVATADAVAQGTQNLLFEASFRWNDLVARADALRRTDGGWIVIEIKSGKSPGDDHGVKDAYLDDIAYTVMVLRNAGLPVAGAHLVLINREYTLEGTAAMFAELDVTAEVSVRAAAFEVAAPAIASAVVAGVCPTPRLIFACKTCEYFERDCLGKGVPDPLFDLPHLTEKRFNALRAFERISRLPPDTELSATQRQVVELVRSGRPVTDREALRRLDHVVWPVSYLDFEAVAPHLPWFAGRPAYDAVPFQYSLHWVAEPGADPVHREYLAPAYGDWRRDLVERLLADLGASGSIVVYSSYEKTRLTALAALFDDLSGALHDAIARLFDLEPVFRRGYVHPGFRGKSSIKKVLPVVVPDLTYEGLEVNNGDDAAGRFALMQVGEYSEHSHEAHRRELLEYCKLDSLAMLRLHQAVLRIRAEPVD